jgi:uncharacterized coiled-coil DUF342 family protein
MASSNPELKGLEEDDGTNPHHLEGLGDSATVNTEKQRLISEEILPSNYKKVHYTQSTKEKLSDHNHKRSSRYSDVDSDGASDRASLGTADGSPFDSQEPQYPRHNPSALSEALDAANDTIRELQEVNEQLLALLKESNKQKRSLKEEKMDLITEVELLGKELDDEKRAHDKLRRDTGSNTITSNPGSQRDTAPLLRSSSSYHKDSGRRYIVPQPPPTTAPNPFSPLSERSSAPAGVTYAPAATVTYSPVAYSTRPGFSARREEISRQLKEVGDLGQGLENEGSASNDEEIHQDIKRNQGFLMEMNKVIVGVSDGDFKQKLAIQPEETGSNIGTLKNSINGMVDKVRAISEQVSRLAEEVGRNGMLGGQVQVPDARGTWRVMVTNGKQMSTTPSQAFGKLFFKVKSRD